MPLKSCNNCVSQIVCKPYKDFMTLINAFAQENGKITTIPFTADVLATRCKHFLSPDSFKVDLLDEQKKSEPEKTEDKTQ